jgi:hypothetical protein
MFNVFRKEIDFAGKTIILETGKIARQADGGRYGDDRRNHGALHCRRREDRSKKVRISSP